MGGASPARAGRGGQGRQQVGGVGAPVARQQGHLMVVLGCGQAGVRRCGGNRTERDGESSGEHLRRFITSPSIYIRR